MENDMQGNEKADRLHQILGEAMKPLLERMDTMENEITALRKEQQELKKALKETQK